MGNLSMDGHRVAIGSPNINGYGGVNVYDWYGDDGMTGWYDVTDNSVDDGDALVGTFDRERYGMSISMSNDGNRIVVGANGFNCPQQKPNCGLIRVYEAFVLPREEEDD